jgi:low temperature requirement protein LtrA
MNETSRLDPGGSRTLRLTGRIRGWWDVRSVDGEERVTPLELFFDVVFAITLVTGFLAANETGEGLLRGALLLAALWWARGTYAWLTNTVDPEEGAVRLAVFAAAAAMLVVALATPEAFGAEAVVFGIAYFLLRALHLVLFAIAARDDPELRRAVLRWAPCAFLGPSLLVGASFFGGSADLALWAAALAVDYLSPQVGHGRGWRLPPAHFVERHGLIMIVALGESIVTIGVGAAGCLSMPPGSRPRYSECSSPRRSGGCTSTASSTSRRPSSPTPQVRRGRRSRATCTRTSTCLSAYGTGDET